MSRPTDTNHPYDASSSRNVKLPIGQLLTLVGAIVAGSVFVVRYTNSLERAIDSLGSKIDNTQGEMRALKREMVFRTPFYAWVGQFRYDVLSGAKSFPPEPRPFFQPEEYTP